MSFTPHFEDLPSGLAAPTPWRRAVAELRALSAPGGRQRHRRCVIEGLRLVERALRAGARVERLVHARGFLEDSSPRARELRRELVRVGCELIEIPEEELERLTEGRALGGIVATAEIPPAPGLDELLSLPRPDGRPGRLVVCVGFNDPGNLGALVRTAHGSGASGLITVGATSAFHPRAVRTSMGSLFRLPVLEYADASATTDALSSLSAELRNRRVRSLAAVTTGGTPLPQLGERDEPLALVFGSEAFGLDAAQEALFDERITIPMAPGVDSFSVSVAAAMVLYELGVRTPGLD